MRKVRKKGKLEQDRWSVYIYGFIDFETCAKKVY